MLMLTLLALAGALPLWILFVVAAALALVLGGMRWIGVTNPDTTYPFAAGSEGVFVNGEGATTIAAGKLVFKEHLNSRTVKLTADALPIGYVGVALSTATIGKELKVRFFGEVGPADLSTGVLDTNAITAAGETFMPAAAGALATLDAVNKRAPGFVKVKSATVGVLFINGLK